MGYGHHALLNPNPNPNPNPNTFKLNGSSSVLSDPDFLNSMNLNEPLLCRNSVNNNVNNIIRSSPSSSSNLNHEDFDLSDVVFKYINQMLMEENIEEKTSMLHEPGVLQAAEKSFYDVLMVNEPMFDSTGSTGFSCDVSDYSSVIGPEVYLNIDSKPGFSRSSNSCVTDCAADSPMSVQSGHAPVTHFQNGVVFKTEKLHETGLPVVESRGKKNHYYSEDVDEDGRIFKQSAVYNDPTVRSKMFDDVLLCSGRKLPQGGFVHSGVNKSQPKSSTKGRSKKGVKRDVVDLRTLLSLCAQAVAGNDQRSAVDLIKQIREHSSPTGDGMQRMAHYFCSGLETRMAGSGTEIYKALLNRHPSAKDILKAYHLFLTCCPFLKISNFLSNKTIFHAAENKKKLHIVDFGILYGFQWPCFIQRLSKRPGGPPELRITGIDFPCPGFRPSERVEETGSRLANYAETFNVPFKFKAIAQKWETITIEDLELDGDETLIVNCAYRFRYLLDETVMVDSPRSKVVNLIRKMNPDLFIQGVINGSYNAPFFITRFREALFFFSSMFDMIEATTTRETPERTLIEKNFWGREAMNVIACEGGERIERPETYKQWQVRNLRAGFRQIPLNREILKMAKERVKSCYHRDFGIDEDGHWLLQGWKGRIIYALSSWKPA
ncbi:scarecrow-like protein 30 [Bidens hawaiensis]|uniref:scarecrow-like protein 30 n=1 Tax=Bidens hawaiensis TaxID=980011 RepID=UPI00404B805B